MGKKAKPQDIDFFCELIKTSCVFSEISYNEYDRFNVRLKGEVYVFIRRI